MEKYVFPQLLLSLKCLMATAGCLSPLPVVLYELKSHDFVCDF